ncbi:MAG: hypothetical protein H6883_09360 [Rhodobiaceae bacterium]|nr:hypothetical protein [Rhodobiaceae bacterium]MCC0056334.1 hypothetical protein [Rhodobiaceae bacterium]
MTVIGRMMIASLLLAAGPVLAAEPGKPAAKPPAQSSPQIHTSAEIPCSCRANGTDYDAGQLVCIRGKVARCGYSLNNTSWQFLGRSCPTS